MNEEGEISSGEHCFISDHEIVKKKFCLDHNGQWNPVGEWQWDKVKKKNIHKEEEKNNTHILSF